MLKSKSLNAYRDYGLRIGCETEKSIEDRVSKVMQSVGIFGYLLFHISTINAHTNESKERGSGN